MISDGKTKRRRTTKTKSYVDEMNMGRAKVGDVICLPSQPEFPVTVTDLPHSFSSRKQIKISWFDQNGELRRDEVDPTGFVKK